MTMTLPPACAARCRALTAREGGAGGVARCGAGGRARVACGGFSRTCMVFCPPCGCPATATPLRPEGGGPV
jgi:hypothetical protein